MNNSLVVTPCNRVKGIDLFKETYSKIHVNLMFVWCPLGIVSNILNIIVLNQKAMRTPTNLLLTSLAVSDALIMLLYIPFASYFLKGGHMESASFYMAVYLLLYVNLNNILHIFSCGVVVTLAVFRLLYAKCLLKCHKLCSQQRAIMAVCILSITATILTIPCMIAHHVIPALEEDMMTPLIINGEEMFTVNYVDTLNLRMLVYWNTAIFAKLLPLICLITLSSLLIATLHQRAKMQRSINRRKFNRHTFSAESSKWESRYSENKDPAKKDPLQQCLESEKNRERTYNRTTYLMLAVMIVYIVTMLPQVSYLYFVKDYHLYRLQMKNCERTFPRRSIKGCLS